jgi:hypothetical protein
MVSYAGARGIVEKDAINLRHITSIIFKKGGCALSKVRMNIKSTMCL